MDSQQTRGALIVTGGSRGIGRAISKLAASRGWTVVINYAQNREAAAKLEREIREPGGKATAVRANVANEEDVVRLFDLTEDEFGGVTGLVNCAGIVGGFYRHEDVPLAKIREVFDVNVIGTMLCAREAVRRMSTKRGGTSGSIVNISSSAARLGSPGEFVFYAASKGAVETFTRGLAREVATEGIRVNAVAAGFIETEAHAQAGDPGRLERVKANIPMKRVGQPEEVAEAVLWLLSPEASYVTGAILDVSGGR